MEATINDIPKTLVREYLVRTRCTIGTEFFHEILQAMDLKDSLFKDFFY